MNPYFDPAKPHHTAAGFKNNYPPNPAYRRPELGLFESWATRLKNWSSDGSERAHPEGRLCPQQAALARQAQAVAEDAFFVMPIGATYRPLRPQAGTAGAD